MLHRHRQYNVIFQGYNAAKMMNIISTKVQFQGFVQKTKQWSQIKNDLAKQKIKKNF